MDEIRIDIDTKLLDELLSQLPEKVAKEYMHQALDAAGQILVTEVKANTPVRTGEITNDMKSTALPPGILREDVTSNNNGKNTLKVGCTSIGSHVMRWVEKGYTLTTHGGKKRKRKTIKNIPGKHIMQRAMDTKGAEAIRAFAEKLAELITADDKRDS